MTTPLWNPQFQGSVPWSESWTDECFKEQVPVANPNYGKCFLAPEGYKITLGKVKENRNWIPWNALFGGQKSPTKAVLCAWFCQDSLKGGDGVSGERRSGWCQPGSQRHVGSWKIYPERLSSLQFGSNVRKNRGFQKIPAKNEETDTGKCGLLDGFWKLSGESNLSLVERTPVWMSAETFAASVTVYTRANWAVSHIPSFANSDFTITEVMYL